MFYVLLLFFIQQKYEVWYIVEWNIVFYKLSHINCHTVNNGKNTHLVSRTGFVLFFWIFYNLICYFIFHILIIPCFLFYVILLIFVTEFVMWFTLRFQTNKVFVFYNYSLFLPGAKSPHDTGKKLITTQVFSTIE